MALQTFQKINIEEFPVAQLQQNVEKALNPVLNKPFMDHTIIENVTVLSASDTTVNHGLGRLVKVVPFNLNANAVVWQKQSSNPAPEVSVLLRASADVTCDLILF